LDGAVAGGLRDHVEHAIVFDEERIRKGVIPLEDANRLRRAPAALHLDHADVRASGSRGQLLEEDVAPAVALQRERVGPETGVRWIEAMEPLQRSAPRLDVHESVGDAPL